MNRTAVLTLRGCLLLAVSAAFIIRFVSATLPESSTPPVHQTPGIITLNDETFEHSTQASTGQTTGSWLVWFHTTNDSTYIEPDNKDDDNEDGGSNTVMIIPTPDVWAERCHAVLAAVNVDNAGVETRKRFQVQQLPSFVYFHKGKLYRYPTPAADNGESSSSYRWADLLAFCQNPAAVTSAEDIPEPPSVWEHLLIKVKNDTSLMLLFGGIIMVIVLGLFVKAIIGAVKAPKPDKSKAA